VLARASWDGQLISDLEKTWLHLVAICVEQGVPNHVVALV